MSTNPRSSSSDLKYGNVVSSVQKALAGSVEVVSTDGNEVRVLKGDDRKSTVTVLDSGRGISVGGLGNGMEGGNESFGKCGGSDSGAMMKGENLMGSGVVGNMDDGRNLIESLDWVMKAAELLVNDGDVAESLGLQFKNDLANVGTLGGSSFGVVNDQTSGDAVVGQGLGPLGDMRSRQSGDCVSGEATVLNQQDIGSASSLQGTGVSYDSIIQDFFAQAPYNIPTNKETAVNDKDSNDKQVKDTSFSNLDAYETNGSNLNGVGPCTSNENQNIPARVQTGNIENSEDSRMKKAKETLSKSGYCVSDLVWGKITSHPWWPGQIFDPSDASKISMNHLKDNRLLVAYFGDGTFAWNESTKLKPFGAHFHQMEKQSNLETFCLAVDCALDEVSERVEYSLSCPCLSDGLYDGFKSQTIRNSGVNTVSRTRETGDEYSDAAAFEPGKLVEYVKRLAMCGVVDRLDIVIARSQLLSFYRFKGYFRLPKFEVYGAVMDNETDILNTNNKRRQIRVIEDGDDEPDVLTTKKRRQSRVIDDDDPDFKVAGQDGSSRKHRRGSGIEISPGKKQSSKTNLMAEHFGSTDSRSTSTNESKESTAVAKKSKRKQAKTSGNIEKSVKQEDTMPSDEVCVKDSYWTATVIKGKTEDQVLPEDQKTNDGTTKVDHTDDHSKEESRPTALMLNFTNVESVPSAIDLNKIFTVYGPLIESKTEVQKNCRRAKVVFENHSDAEAAFSSAGKYSIFGPSLMSYRLKYLPSPPKRSSARVAKRGRKSSAEGDSDLFNAT